MFSEFWSNLLYKRGDMEDVKNADPIEAINNTWFYAGLFHDVCVCIKVSPIQQPLLDIVEDRVNDVLQDITKPLNDDINPIVKKSITENEPDHGFVGGVYLTQKIQQTNQKNYVCEAARALILHNITGDFEKENADVIER